MEHADHLVDILDATGNVIKQKPRRLVDKTVDIYHGVQVLIVTPQGEFVLSKIPRRTDLPNLYASQLGATLATIRRSSETATQAASRALKNELFIEEADLQLLGDGMVTLNDGHITYLSAFYLRGEPPTRYSTVDVEALKILGPEEFREALEANPGHFAPTVHLFRERYGKLLDL